MIKHRHRLPACVCGCVGIMACLISEESASRIHHGEGFTLSPGSMSEAEWTLVPGIGARTAGAIFAASGDEEFASLYGDELELAMLSIPGIGPETVRSARDFLSFGPSGVHGEAGR